MSLRYSLCNAFVAIFIGLAVWGAPLIMDGDHYAWPLKHDLSYTQSYQEFLYHSLELFVLNFIPPSVRFQFIQILFVFGLFLVALRIGKFGFLIFFSILFISPVFNNVRQGGATILFLLLISWNVKSIVLFFLPTGFHFSAIWFPFYKIFERVISDRFYTRPSKAFLFVFLFFVIIFFIAIVFTSYSSFIGVVFSEGRAGWIQRNLSGSLAVISAWLALLQCIYIKHGWVVGIDKNRCLVCVDDLVGLCYLCLGSFLCAILFGNLYSSSEIFSRFFAFGNLILPFVLLSCFSKTQSPLCIILFIFSSITQNQFWIGVSALYSSALFK